MPAVNFVIGGAQKCGTTALHAILSDNPDIYLHSSKELHFFDKDDNFPDDRAWNDCIAPYEARFEDAPAVAITGEATPAYLWADQAAERVARYNPAMKWLICLRDPKWRAVSHWQMQVELGATNLSFEEAIAREIHSAITTPGRQRPGASYIARGLYAKQIDRLFRLFGRRNVLVLIHDDLTANFEATMTRIDAFLFKTARFPYTNRIVGENANASPFKMDTVSLLNEIFLPDIALLERRLGVDLAAWKRMPAAG